MIRKDIRLAPEHDKLIFIDGYAAWILGATIVIKDNIDWVRYYLLPSEELVKRYEIVRDMLDDNLCLEREYPKDMIENLNDDDPTRKAKFCLFNFNGQETPTTKKFKGLYDFKKELMEIKRECNGLKSRNAFLEEENFIASTNAVKFVKNNFGAFSDVFIPMIRNLTRVEAEGEKATGKGQV